MMRFAFGKNWSNFLKHLNEAKIAEAEKSLRQFLDCTDLNQKSFVDIGSGSGLFSLSAMRLGASKVLSFDYDSESVKCMEALKNRFYPSSPQWIVEQGSALDEAYMKRLGQFDVVYSWGVLHHTGDMWKALALAAERVLPGGKIYVSIYNDQGERSQLWKKVKRLYNYLPRLLRPVLLLICGIVIWGSVFLKDLIKHANPFHTWITYTKNRGMSPWHDLVDWVGGFPFEVAKPEEIFEFFKKRGFVLKRLVTCAGGYGCNEYLFALPSVSPR